MILSHEHGNVQWLHDHQTSFTRSRAYATMTYAIVMAGNAFLCDMLGLQEAKVLQASSQSDLTQQQVCPQHSHICCFIW